mgnify:FL=1
MENNAFFTLFSGNIASWLILSSLILFALYTLMTIKTESSDFLDEAVFYSLKQIKLPIPYWWTIIEQEEDKKLVFKRTDTYYDWNAHFSYLDSSGDLDLLLGDYLQDNKIEFDPDVSIETRNNLLFTDQSTLSAIQSCIRVEGKATQDEHERLHLEIYLFRLKNDSRCYFFCSKSSVLNGLVEGPFFEEAILNMKLISS